MPGPKEIAVAFIVAIAIANIAVSVALVRSHFYSGTQKAAQLAIIWLIPLFGVVGIGAFLRAQYRWEKYDTRAFPEQTQKGVAIEVQNAIHDAGGGGTPSD
jgi:hypothetical protein